jgi:poly-gamma-glutamate synthesis protein (capsule biosynthesis protein)
MTSGTRLVTCCLAAVVATAGVALGPASTSTAATDLPAFTSSVQRIDADLKDRMAYSWRRGCPVPRWKLRYVTVTYVDFKGAARQGELVVHKAVAADLVGAFEAMYDSGFRIKRMRLVDDYGGSDAASMAANNTSAFNCRRVARTTRWSEHAYGKAIDINPVRNPYVDGDRVAPTAGEAYVERRPLRKGMVNRAVRDAFAAIGWGWGGTWTKVKDYQHFSATGR